MNIPTIETMRLVLRPWTMQDAQELYAILQEENILRYFPRTTPPPLDRVEKYITYHLKHWQERGYGHWAVVEKSSGAIIGWNGLEFLPDTEETEVAYLLSHAYWLRGYATEAARAAVEYGFETAGLSSIIGLVHPENIASRRVLEKCNLSFIDQKMYFGITLMRFRIERPGPGSEEGNNHDN